MANRSRCVNSVAELIAATNDKEIREIVLLTDLEDIPAIDLLPGQTLRSDSAALPTLTFRPDADGVRLSSDNTVAGVNLIASPENSRDMERLFGRQLGDNLDSCCSNYRTSADCYKGQDPEWTCWSRWLRHTFGRRES